jgi:hypothetical protein
MKTMSISHAEHSMKRIPRIGSRLFALAIGSAVAVIIVLGFAGTSHAVIGTPSYCSPRPPCIYCIEQTTGGKCTKCRVSHAPHCRHARVKKGSSSDIIRKKKKYIGHVRPSPSAIVRHVRIDHCWMRSESRDACSQTATPCNRDCCDRMHAGRTGRSPTLLLGRIEPNLQRPMPPGLQGRGIQALPQRVQGEVLRAIGLQGVEGLNRAGNV